MDVECKVFADKYSGLEGAIRREINAGHSQLSSHFPSKIANADAKAYTGILCMSRQTIIKLQIYSQGRKQ